VSIFGALLAVLAGYAFVTWFALPLIEARWNGASTAAKMSKAGAVAGVRTVSDFLKIAFWVFLSAVVVFWALAVVSAEASGATLVALHEFAATLEAWTKWVRDVLSLAALWIAILALSFFAYRARRGALVEALNREQRQQLQALRERAMKGELEDLPEDEAMKGAKSELALIDARIRQARADRRPDEVLRQLMTIREQQERRVRAIDLGRRVDLTKVPVFEAPPSGPLAWLRVILFSRGMGESLSGASKWLARLGTAVACVLMLGIASPAIASMAIEPTLDRIVDLQVLRNEAAARASLRRIAARTQGPPPQSPPTPPNDEDEIYARAASHFLHALARSPEWEAAVRRSRPNDTVAVRAVSADVAEEAAVRQTILQIGASGPDADRQIAAVALGGPDTSQPVPSRYERYRGRLAQGGRPSAWADAEERIAGWLREAARRSPAIRERIRAGAASFTAPRLASDFATDAVGELVSNAVKLALPAPTDAAALDQPVRSSASKSLQTAAARFAEQKLANLLNALSSNQDYATAMRAVSSADGGEILFHRNEAAQLRDVFGAAESDRRAIAAALVDNPPSLVQRASQADAELVERYARGLSPSTDRAVVRSVFEGQLGTYEDLFPSQRAARPTPLAAALGEGSGPSIPIDLPAGMPELADARRSGGPAAASRSFARMSRSFRVGGVVIGAQPTGGRRLDLADLAWARDGRQFRLALIGRNGDRHEVGTFSGAMIQQALAYAADGRVTAVTMTDGPLNLRLRVHVHPALVNTDLGLTLIRVDTFADGARPPGSPADRWRTRAFKQLQAYRAAYQLAAPDQDLGRPRQLPERSPADLAALFPPGWNVDDPLQSFFAHHEGRFDRDLVRRIAECARNARNDHPTFNACVASYRVDAARFRDQNGTVWTGVRERAYPLGPAAFATRTQSPLRFMMQMAFAAQRNCESEECRSEESRPPWEFPMLRDEVDQSVQGWIRGKSEQRAVLDEAGRFTILQRLFRVALAGHLGPAFPRGRLVRLMQEAKEADPVRVRETPRWGS
jgi:YD repeat-containing protein